MCVGVPPSSASFLREHLCEDMNRAAKKGAEYKALQALDNPQRHGMCVFSHCRLLTLTLPRDVIYEPRAAWMSARTEEVLCWLSQR